jgi:glycosyltransferase involved in cell wall biosynthesis
MSTNNRMSAPPVITVITATWNCASTIEECLRSVQQQDYAHREHIVVDGGSSDGTRQTLEKHARNFAKFISEKDLGIYDALNKGISLATGDVVGFLHADDIYASENALSTVAAPFGDPAVCAVYGDLVYVKQHDPSRVVRLWRSGSFNQKMLLNGWMPPHPTLYVRREWYERIGGFNIGYRVSADFDSVLRLFSQHRFKAVHVPQVIVRMRTGGASNRSLAAICRKSAEDWHALRSNGFSVPRALRAITCKNLGKLTQLR